MHYRQPGFTYSDLVPFKKQIKNKKVLIYQNELDKTCFQHGIAHWYFRDFTGWKACNKTLLDTASDIAENPK